MNQAIVLLLVFRGPAKNAIAGRSNPGKAHSDIFEHDISVTSSDVFPNPFQTRSNHSQIILSFFFFLLDRFDFVVVESSSEDDVDDDPELSGLEGGEPDGPLPPWLSPPSGGSPPPPYPRKGPVSVSTLICD